MDELNGAHYYIIQLLNAHDL